MGPAGASDSWRSPRTRAGGPWVPRSPCLGPPRASGGGSHGPQGPSQGRRGVPWVPKGPSRVLQGGPLGPQGPGAHPGIPMAPQERPGTPMALREPHGPHHDSIHPGSSMSPPLGSIWHPPWDLNGTLPGAPRAMTFGPLPFTLPGGLRPPGPPRGGPRAPPGGGPGPPRGKK